MENYNETHEHSEHSEHNAQTALGFLAGMVIGGLAGAGTMLLWAPQSGKRTRAQIQRKTLALREQATDTLEEKMEQARVNGRRISAGVHKQAEELQERGQALYDEQKERVVNLVDAGKKAVKGSSH
jgi:gas vesicle protein